MIERRARSRSAIALSAVLLLTASRAPLADVSPSEAPPPLSADAPATSTAQTLRYRVTVDAPDALRATLAASIDLVRWQTYGQMTESLFDALAQKAVEQAKEAAATEGYFSASVAVDIARDARPIEVTLRVVPGAQARVASADLDVSGAATTDAEGEAAIARMKREWPLQPGAAFRQSLWIDAKRDAIATLAGSAFAAATLTASEARVDTGAGSVALDLAIDSGPAFRVGDLDVQGLSRYAPDLVSRYRSQKPGDRYSIAELNQFVRRLTGTGYFASVHAAIDADPAVAANAPVQVAVIEAPPKKLEAGLGYSTDTAFRANVSYRDVDVDAHALQMFVDARVESKVQSASLRFVEPPSQSGWSRATFARIQRTDISGLETESSATGLRMSSLDERNQWQYGAAFYTDRQQPSGFAPASSRALYVDIERAWRRVDDLAAPTSGFIALVQLGAGIPGLSTRGFERATVRYAWWLPINRLWSLTARAEAGAVLAGDRNDIPSELLFRTGGDTTVRGYAFESLGIEQGSTVLPARYYTAASIEATRWINDTWGIAAFVDAGNAFDEWSELDIAVGYGVGARVKTPIGPLRLDVAYGERSRQVRLHFSVGVSF